MARKLQPFEKDLFAIVATLNEVADGRSNNVGEVTFTPGAASTAVTFPTTSTSSKINLSPLTPSAAAATWWIVSKLNGSFVIGHDVSAAVDRIFDFSCVGG